MKILSLDAAMAACSAALIDTEREGPVAEAFVPMERGHAEALAPMVAGVMVASGLDFTQIDRIAVTTGPGSFTGVRIGLSFARGLGMARGIPVIGIDSLSAIAANEPAMTHLLVVADARNGDVYAACFDAERRLVRPPHITRSEMAADGLPSGSLIIGTAARAVRDASGRLDLTVSPAGDLPMAAHFANLAASRLAGAMPTPLYIRAPDAKPQTTQMRKLDPLEFKTMDFRAAAMLSALHAETFAEGWTAGAFEALLQTPGAAAAVAVYLGEPVAFLVTRTAADEAEILSIGTRPSAQRRGVAQRLLQQHVAALTTQGIRQLFLEVAADNTAAQGLYATLGFREAGRRKGYYKRDAGVVDAIVMRRDLGP